MIYVIILRLESVVDECCNIIDSVNECYLTLILLIIMYTSSHTWLSLLLIIERRRREFGHWNFTLPFAILSCCVPLWFNRQLNFLMKGSALCVTPIPHYNQSLHSSIDLRTIAAVNSVAPILVSFSAALVGNCSTLESFF